MALILIVTFLLLRWIINSQLNRVVPNVKYYFNMKYPILLLCLNSVIFFQGITQPCLSTGISFSTQSELDSFPILYPNCTEVLGDVIVDGNNESLSLASLIGITSIQGNLIIENAFLDEDFMGLNNLSYIGGDFVIQDCGGYSLEGLGSLAHIDGNFELINYSLSDFFGCYNLETIGGDFNLVDLYNLGGFFGLENLHQIHGSFNLSGVEVFGFFSLSALDTIGGDFVINNDIFGFDFSGLENLNVIGGSFELGSGSFFSLQGLEGLHTVQGDLVLYDLFSFFDANALSNLEVVNGTLSITNTGINSLEGFSNVNPDSLDYLILHSNYDLEICNYDNICTFMSNNDNYEIYNNAGFCEDDEMVLYTCNTACPLVALTLTTQTEVDEFVSTYPNCEHLLAALTINSEEEDPILNLDSLYPIQSIFGSLTIIDNEELLSLEGLANLDSITGDLSIQDNPLITSLDGLSGLSHISSSIFINNNDAIMNLSGLENVSGAIFNLFVQDNELLASLNGLSSVSEISTTLDISRNPNLISLQGLNSLDHLEFALKIIDNDQLTNLEGLENILSVDLVLLKIEDNENLQSLTGLILNGEEVDNIFIEDNPVLADLVAFEDMTLLFGALSITNNDQLQNLEAFTNVSFTAVGTFTIKDNESLQSLEGINISESILGDVQIMNNPVLQDLGMLEDVTTIFGELNVSGNNRLTDFAECSSLVTINGPLFITDNDSLLNLNGLSNLVSLDENLLAIIGNPVLSDISGIASLSPFFLSNLFIESNPMLAVCDINSICEYLDFGNDGSFLENAPGCNSQLEVETACGLIDYIEEITMELVQIIPNPSVGVFRIENWNRKQGQYKIYNTLGHLVQEGKFLNQALFDISNNPNGIYYISVFDKEVNITRRILKQSN